MVLQIKVLDTEQRRAVTKDEPEGHKVSRVEASQGELEEIFEEKDVWLERNSKVIMQLEGKGGTGDSDGAERRTH